MMAAYGDRQRYENTKNTGGLRFLQSIFRPPATLSEKLNRSLVATTMANSISFTIEIPNFKMGNRSLCGRLFEATHAVPHSRVPLLRRASDTSQCRLKRGNESCSSLAAGHRSLGGSISVGQWLPSHKRTQKLRG